MGAAVAAVGVGCGERDATGAAETERIAPPADGDADTAPRGRMPPGVEEQAPPRGELGPPVIELTTTDGWSGAARVRVAVYAGGVVAYWDEGCGAVVRWGQIPAARLARLVAEIEGAGFLSDRESPMAEERRLNRCLDDPRSTIMVRHVVRRMGCIRTTVIATTIDKVAEVLLPSPCRSEPTR